MTTNTGFARTTRDTTSYLSGFGGRKHRLPAGTVFEVDERVTAEQLAAEGLTPGVDGVAPAHWDGTMLSPYGSVMVPLEDAEWCPRPSLPTTADVQAWLGSALLSSSSTAPFEMDETDARDPEGPATVDVAGRTTSGLPFRVVLRVERIERVDG